MSDDTIKIEQYWQSRWWEKPAIRSHLKASDIEISNAISLLRQEFDQAWFDSIDMTLDQLRTFAECEEDIMKGK